MALVSVNRYERLHDPHVIYTSFRTRATGMAAVINLSDSQRSQPSERYIRIDTML